MKWLKVGLDVLKKVAGATKVIETIADAIPGLRGSSKRDGAIRLAKELLEELGEPYMRLMDDPRVKAASEQFIDGAVHFQNVLAVVAKEQGLLAARASSEDGGSPA